MTSGAGPAEAPVASPWDDPAYCLTGYLTGFAAIGRELGITVEAAELAHQRGELPTFDLDGQPRARRAALADYRLSVAAYRRARAANPTR